MPARASGLRAEIPLHDVLQGTLDLPIDKSLEKGPMHGYGIASPFKAPLDAAYAT